MAGVGEVGCNSPPQEGRRVAVPDGVDQGGRIREETIMAACCMPARLGYTGLGSLTVAFARRY